MKKLAMIFGSALMAASAAQASDAASQIQAVKAALLDVTSSQSEVTYAGQDANGRGCIATAAASKDSLWIVTYEADEDTSGMWGAYDSMDLTLDARPEYYANLKTKITPDTISIAYDSLYGEKHEVYSSYVGQVKVVQKGNRKFLTSVRMESTQIADTEYAKAGKKEFRSCSALKPVLTLAKAQEKRMAKDAYQKFAKNMGPLTGTGGCVVALPTRLNCGWGLETDYTEDTLHVTYEIKDGKVGKVISHDIEYGC